MYVKQIHIDTFLALKDVNLGPFKAPGETAEQIVLAGPNGGGKSSILDLIGWVMSQARGVQFHTTRSNYGFRGSIEFGFTPDEVAVLRVIDGIDVNRGLTRAHFEKTNSIEVYFDGEPKWNDNNFMMLRIADEILRSVHQCVSGVYVRADRNYPRIGFNPQSIFEYEHTRVPLNTMGISFGNSEGQYRDLHDHLAQQNYHYVASMGLYLLRHERGEVGADERPVDPLIRYSDLLGRVLPMYRFADAREGVPQDLTIKLPSGVEISFGDLSAGEKEVFFLLAMFLRYEIKSAIVLIDEPEMHLHPELGRTLVRELQYVAPRSQIWMATHNPEVIDEVGRDRVTYIAPTEDRSQILVTSASEESSWSTQLRGIFGQSGYVGVGKIFLFTEGQAASVDRKTFSTLFPEYSNRLKIVPSGGFDSHLRINAAVLALLEESLVWVKFYLVRDRDYLTDEMTLQYKAKSRGRIHVLSRCQIENYALDFDAISWVMREIYNRRESPEQLREKFRMAALEISGEVAAALVSFRLNQLASPQDFSFPRLFANEPMIGANGGIIDAKRDTLVEMAVRRAGGVLDHVRRQTEPGVVESQVVDWVDEVANSFSDPDDAWLRLFPAKDLFKKFAKKEKIGPEVALINSALRAIAASGTAPEELRILVKDAVEGAELS